MCATWRSRADGSWTAPTVSYTSWACAHVSMIRAVSDEAALIGGPNHGTRVDGSSPRNPASSRPRASSNQVSSSLPDRSRKRSAMVSGLTPPSASIWAFSAVNASGSVAERSATSSKYARCETWSAIVQPAAGVSCPHAASESPARTVRRSADSAARSSHSAVIDTGIALPPRPDRRALVAERGRSLLRVRRPVHRRPDSRGPLVLLVARQLRRQVRRPLRRAHRQRRVRGDPRGELLGPVAELAGRDHVVDQTDLEGAARVERVPGQEDLQRHPRREQPGQRSRPRRSPPDLHLGHREPRVLGGHHEVALLGEEEPAGVGDTVDRRDRRLRYLDVAAELRQEVRRRDLQRVLRHLLEVAARAERLVAGAGG